MKQHDQNIHRTLSALRNVATPPGLEWRVLRVLDERLAKCSKESPGGHRAAWFSVTNQRHRWALAATCTVMLAAVATTLYHPGRRTPMAVTQSPADSTAPSTTKFASLPPLPPSLARLPPPPLHRAATHRVRLHIPARTEPPSQALISQAPAPLTEQERLLQQIARAGDSSQFAMLDRDRLAQRVAEGDCEFGQFFFPHPVQNP